MNEWKVMRLAEGECCFLSESALVVKSDLTSACVTALKNMWVLDLIDLGAIYIMRHDMLLYAIL